jgi:hypothetical protein
MSRVKAIAANLQVSWVDFSFLALMAQCQQGPPPEKDSD